MHLDKCGQKTGQCPKREVKKTKEKDFKQKKTFQQSIIFIVNVLQPTDNG